MRNESLHNGVPSSTTTRLRVQLEDSSISELRSKRDVSVVSLEAMKTATRLIKAGDAAMSYKHSAAMMERIIDIRASQGGSLADKTITDIPHFSTFGMAWARLTKAIMSEPFASFAQQHKIDPATLRLNTRDGWAFECIADGKPATFSKYDEGFWEATAAVTAAAQALSPTLKLDINYTGQNSAPADLVGDFYAVRAHGAENEMLHLIAEQNQHQSFYALRDPYSPPHTFGRPARVIREQQQETIEDLATQIATKTGVISPSQHNPKPSVEEADLQMARLYSSALLSLRPEMSRFGSHPRTTFSVSEIPEHSTLGQTLRRSATPPGKNPQLSLSWIGKFYGEPNSDGTLAGLLKQTSTLNQKGFHALSKDNPPTDKRSQAVRKQQFTVIKRLDTPNTKPGAPASPTAPALPDINPLATLARSQFAAEPSLYTVVARLLSDKIKAISPALDIDVNQIAIASPIPGKPGQLKQTQLIELAIDYLAGGKAPDFSSDYKAFDTRPDLLAHTGNSPGVPLELDLPTLSAAIRALPSQLNAAIDADSRLYWNKPAFSSPAEEGSVFPGNHRALVSSILRSNLQESGLKQPGLDDEQREVLNTIVMYPNNSTLSTNLSPPTFDISIYTISNSKADMLVHRYLPSQKRHILLLMQPNGNITPYNSWDDIPKEKRGLNRLTGNVFDTQAGMLIEQHQGSSLFNVAPRMDTNSPEQANTKLPDWMSNADQAQRFVLHELSLLLATFIRLNKGNTYNDDIPDIRSYTQAQFDQLPIAQKRTPYSAKDLEVVFKVPYGTLSSGFIDRQTMSLTDMFLKNLSGMPNGEIEVFFKTGLKNNGNEFKVRVPALEERGVLKKLVQDLDIGQTYPALLKNKLLDDPDKSAQRRVLFTQQVPLEIQMKALELCIKKESGFNATGFRYVQKVLEPVPGPKIVDAKEIVIRPLAFDNKANGKVDVVEGAYLIEPKDSTTGPHILYRPLMADAPLMQFPTRQALLEAIQSKGKLQNDTLAWLPDDTTRKLYSGNGFKHPNLVIFGFNLGSVALNKTIPLAVDTRLQQTLQEGKLMEHLYEANAQNLITLAHQQSTSDAESRWATFKEGGFLLLNTLLPVLRGPGALLNQVLTATGILKDLEVLSGDNMRAKEAALADMFLNLSTLLAHFKPHLSNEPATSTSPNAAKTSVNAARGGALLIDDAVRPPAPPKNRIVLGGRADVKPLAGDIQVFVDEYNGSKRLNIMGHGEKPTQEHAGHILGEGDKHYTAADIDQELLARGIDIRSYTDVRLLSCYSSNGGQQSLASTLSKLTGVRVKGFEQEIIASYAGFDDKDPSTIYGDALTRYREQYPSLSDSDIHILAEEELNDTLAGRNIKFNVDKDTGTEVEINIGSDEEPVMYRTIVDYQPRTFGAPKTKAVPEPIDVLMGYSHSVEDAHSVLSTRSLTDCSALAVLTDLKDGVYQKRTLMHLTGSNLDAGLLNEDAYEVLDELDKSLAKGGKVIFVGGTESQSPVGMGFVLGQESQGKKPLLDLLNKPGVETTIASSVGVSVNPDGTFKLIEGTGKGVFTQPMIDNVLRNAE